MLNDSVFYHGITRKCIIGFGRLFSNIFIDRKVNDPVDRKSTRLNSSH
mgnify:CR=1 FL=1